MTKHNLQCPEQFAKNIFLLYAKLEEEHGMARHAMAVYDRAVQKVHYFNARPSTKWLLSSR